MKTYESEVKKITSKFEKQFDVLQKKFNSELRAESLKAKKIITTKDSNLIWDKKYAGKHAILMKKMKDESIKLWQEYQK